MKSFEIPPGKTCADCYACNWDVARGLVAKESKECKREEPSFIEQPKTKTEEEKK